MVEKLDFKPSVRFLYNCGGFDFTFFAFNYTFSSFALIPDINSKSDVDAYDGFSSSYFTSSAVFVLSPGDMDTLFISGCRGATCETFISIEGAGASSVFTCYRSIWMLSFRVDDDCMSSGSRTISMLRSRIGMGSRLSIGMS
jgi:hypothetical protein